MYKRRYLSLLIGFLYLMAFLYFSRFDLFASDTLTSVAVPLVVEIGARFGPLPAPYVLAYCLRCLSDYYGHKRLFQAAVIVLFGISSYQIVQPPLTSPPGIVMMLGIWAVQYITLLELPVPSISSEHKTYLQLGVMITVAAFLLVQIMKLLWGRPRYIALMQNEESFAEWFRIAGFALRDDLYRSFPSGHTVCASSIFFLTFLPELFEDRSIRPWVCWLTAIVYTAFVAFTRIMGGMHFISDVMAGCGVYLLCYALLVMAERKRGLIS